MARYSDCQENCTVDCGHCKGAYGLIMTEYNLFKRSPDWELNNIWKALHLFSWLNGPEENARIEAIKIIRRERLHSTKGDR